MQTTVISNSISRSGNAVGRNPKKGEYNARPDASVKVLGKLCPRCGEAGAVLYETTQRIIYECPNEHQYETKKRLDDSRDDGIKRCSRD
jgi:ribosomal protein S27AE